MKFAPVSLALALALSSATVAPAFAQYDGRYDGRNDGRYDNRYDHNDSRDRRYQESVRYYEDACRREKRDRRNTGAVLGAITGAVIGSNVAGHGNKTGGAIIGGAAGAAVGSNVGRASVRCDDTGAFWAYNETYDYRSYRGYHGRYDDDWYARRNCRWVRDWRGDYARVCPDRYGRYRYTY